jgi:hypothetical protein
MFVKLSLFFAIHAATIFNDLRAGEQVHHDGGE